MAVAAEVVGGIVMESVDRNVLDETGAKADDTDAEKKVNTRAIV